MTAMNNIQTLRHITDILSTFLFPLKKGNMIMSVILFS